MNNGTAVRAKFGNDEVVSWALTSQGRIASISGITRCLIICVKEDNSAVVIDSNSVAAFSFSATKVVNGIARRVIQWKPGIAIKNLFPTTGVWKADMYVYDAVHPGGLLLCSFDLDIVSIIDEHVAINFTITTQAGALANVGYAPTVLMSQVRQPASGSIALVGIQPVMVSATIIKPNAAALTIGTTTPLIPRTISPLAGSLALTGNAPRVDRALIQPARQSLTLTGTTVTRIQGTIRVPSSGALALAGAQAALGGTILMTAGENSQPADDYDQRGYADPAFYTPGIGSLGAQTQFNGATLLGIYVNQFIDPINGDFFVLEITFPDTVSDSHFTSVSFIDNVGTPRTFLTSAQSGGGFYPYTGFGMKFFGWDQTGHLFDPASTYTITFA